MAFFCCCICVIVCRQLSYGNFAFLSDQRGVRSDTIAGVFLSENKNGYVFFFFFFFKRSPGMTETVQYNKHY